MAVEKIPLSKEPAFSQITTLSGRDYRLDFDFIERGGQIVLDLALDDDTRLLSAIALVPSRLLLEGFENIDRPPGDLIVLAAGDSVTPAEIEADTAELFYLTDEDLDRFRDILATQPSNVAESS